MEKKRDEDRLDSTAIDEQIHEKDCQSGSSFSSGFGMRHLQGFGTSIDDSRHGGSAR